MITSPSGIDIYPSPPRARGLRRAIVLGVSSLAAIIVAVIMYSINAHGTVAAWSKDVPGTAVQPATAAAAKIVARQNQAPPKPASGGSPLGVGKTPSQPEPAQAPRTLAAQPARPAQYAQANVPLVGLPGVASTPPLSPAEQAEQAAMAAPATFSGWNKTTTTATAQPGAPGPSVMSDQDDKEQFLKRKPPSTALAASRVQALSPYEIKAGWLIPAVLESQMNSDLPGDVTGLTRENVYDTATGRYLLIPQGSRLIGSYDSHVAYGQRGVQAVWYRIIFPDASSLVLEGMTGHDSQGQSGFRDKVDNHYKKLIGTALLTSAFFAAGALAQNRHGTVLGYPSPQETAASAAASNMSEQMVEITRRNLNIQPTLVIRAGYLYNVFVSKDIAFEGPYRPLPPLTR